MTWHTVYASPAQDLCGSLSAEWRDYVTEDRVGGWEPKLKAAQCWRRKEKTFHCPASGTEWRPSGTSWTSRINGELVLSCDLILTTCLALKPSIQAVILPSCCTHPKLWLSPFLSAVAICTHFFLFIFFCQSRKRNIKRPDERLPPHAGDLLRHAANDFVPPNALRDSTARTAVAPQIYISNKSQRHGNIFLLIIWCAVFFSNRRVFNHPWLLPAKFSAFNGLNLPFFFLYFLPKHFSMHMWFWVAPAAARGSVAYSLTAAFFHCYYFECITVDSLHCIQLFTSIVGVYIIFSFMSRQLHQLIIW